jgi:hypothetical protein
VIVLPDYKVVENIPASSKGADRLHKRALDASLTRLGAAIDPENEEDSQTLSYPLPYACVIMLCGYSLNVFALITYG